MALEFSTRKIVKSKDLNTNGTLHGGRLLHWVDEESGIFCAHNMDTHLIITRSMGKATFKTAASFRDVIEFGMEIIKIGRTKLTVRCVVRDLYTKTVLATVDDIVCVCTNAEGRPIRHAMAGLTGVSLENKDSAALKSLLEADKLAENTVVAIGSHQRDHVKDFPMERALNMSTTTAG